MTNQSKTNTPTPVPSALDKFSLSFEYDVPWSAASQTVKPRPSKK